MESQSESQSDLDLDTDWAQIEEDLRQLCTLQTEASRRMEALQVTLSLQQAGMIPIIQSCHEASLEELEQTGEVTFGARLLQVLSKTTESKVSS